MTKSGDLSVLRPIPFRAIWPSLHKVTCDLCPAIEEVWFEHASGFKHLDPTQTAALLNRIMAGYGWLHVTTQMAGGGARSEWVCPACAAAIGDDPTRDVSKAATTQAELSRIWIFRQATEDAPVKSRRRAA